MAEGAALVIVRGTSTPAQGLETPLPTPWLGRRIQPLAGVVGMLGVAQFSTSLVVLHVARLDIDWRHHYVSNFASGSFAWLFVSAALIHGFGNLVFGLGLGSALGPVRFRASAVALFALAAVGIVLAGVFATDPPGASPTVTGLAHSFVVSVSFPSELIALFLFSLAFARQPQWRCHGMPSFVMSAIAGAALIGLILAARLGRAPALAERVVLGCFLAWEFWAAFRLSRLPPPPGLARS